MMKNYVFIANSTKPSIEERKSRNKVKLSNFSKPCLEVALDLGYEVYTGINRDKPEQLSSDINVKFYDEHIYRNVFAIKDNYIAYKNLLKLLNKGDFEVIHCNTPLGGVIGRLCGNKVNIPKIVYTVHGFHFYKGAPLINRTLFKWVEMWLAHYTDVLITINNEDYQAAQKLKLRKNGKVYYLPGVGVDTTIFREAISKRQEMLHEINANDSTVLLISVGELNKNKNNRIVIEALGKIQNPNIHYIMCGVGDTKNEMIELIKINDLEKNVHYFGYRTDIPQLLKSCDIFLMPSYREGLARSIMEAMASGLPCIVSKIRGNVDLIDDIKGGFLFPPDDVEGLSKAINDLASNIKLRKSMGSYNNEKVIKFDIENVKIKIKKIYEDELK